MLKIFSYIFYIIAVGCAIVASFNILVQMFPEYGIFHILVGLVGTLMFFPLIPIYPAVYDGEWTYLIICYTSILIGVILGNKSRIIKQ